MGGAGGHMNHPHDLDHVKNGEDFIKFFTKELPSILFQEGSSPAKFTVKLDGVNATENHENEEDEEEFIKVIETW